MSDNQWPRFQVLAQEKEGSPYQDVGSVHAPDAEMALLNARDVFVRRPECSGLWVVSAETIFSRTQEELEADPLEVPPSQGKPGEYLVFCKRRSAGTQTLAGSVEARSPEEALQKGIEAYSGKTPPFAWWVIPAGAVISSEPEDAPSFFSPALDKPFRLSTDFHTVSAMRSIRRQAGSPSETSTGDECALPERSES